MSDLTKSGISFSLDALVASLEKKEEKTEKAPSKQERVSYWTDKATKEELVELFKSVSSYADKMVEATESLSQEQVDALGEEYLLWQKFNDFLESRNKTFRGMVFSTLDEQASQTSSSVPPHQTKGKLVANTSEGKLSFNREGGDRKKPTVDVDRLKEVVGDSRFEKLTDKIKVRRQVIPAHTEEKFSEEKFVEAVYNGDITFEEAQEVLIPGAWQTPRFTVRRVK